MKKIITFLFFTLLNFLLIAQNNEYIQHITKAKEYEENQQWIHALGEYWDAMEADNENSKEAFLAWDKIADAIKDGKPGTDEYDDFDTYDYWALMQEEYEDFWYEECPVYFNFSDFKKGRLDYETRTASYSITLTSKWMPKYLKIKDIVSVGYKKAYRDDWNLESKWPEYSCRKTGEKITKANDYYDYYEKGFKNLAVSYYSANYESSCKYYAIECSIIGDNGIPIIEDIFISDNENYVISGVDRNGIKLFDSKKVKIVPKKVVIYKLGNKEVWDPVKDCYCYECENTDLLKDTNIIINTQDKPAVNPVDVERKFSVMYGKICKMVTVSGGSFSMGSNKGNYTQKPVHTVTVSSFEMGATEVTNELYEMIMGSSNNNHEDDKKPVSNIYWSEMIYFCNKLSELCGYTPCYKLDGESDVSKWNTSLNYENRYSELKGELTCDFTANGFRLPTEAEWEYAAVEGSKNSVFTYSGNNSLNEVAWYANNSNYRKNDVATKMPNALGIFDLSGNVKERCWDYFSKEYYSESPSKNPKGPESNSYNERVIRGGSYSSDEEMCRVAFRSYLGAGYYDYTSDIGFRLVRTIK